MADKGLSGQRFPCHVQPQADELLSSWLTRLSLAHGLQPRTFCTILWPATPIWIGDLDWRATSGMLSLLAQKTATSRQRAFATSLRAYASTLWEGLSAYGSRPWLLLGARQSQRSGRPGLQYCPQCLRADATPYFRRCWRLGFMTVCTAHRRRLLDRCAACGEPVTLHCLPSETETITRCARCQHDLRAIEAPGLEDSPLHQRVVAFQAWLLTALSTGWCQLAVPGRVRLAPYLRVLHQLACVLATHPRADYRRAQLCYRCDQPFFALCFPAVARRVIEALAVTDRFRLMLLLAWWVEDWPEHFIAVCLETCLWPRELLARMPAPPVWFADIVQNISWWEALHRLTPLWQPDTPDWHPLKQGGWAEFQRLLNSPRQSH